MTIIQTTDSTIYKPPGFMQTTGAIAAGAGTGYLVKQISNPLFRRMKNFELKEYKNADYSFMKPMVEETITKSGMREKGVKSGYWTAQRAGFAPKSNTVFVNLEKSAYSVFHELGHAINFHNSPFWKSIQKAKPLCRKFLPVPFVIALLKRKKGEDEKPSGFLDKATTFIKNNAGKLTFATFLPVIAEELSATIKGNHLAKRMLGSNYNQIIFRINAIGTSSYLIYGLLSGIAAYTGLKVRDALSAPKTLTPEKSQSILTQNIF